MDVVIEIIVLLKTLPFFWGAGEMLTDGLQLIREVLAAFSEPVRLYAQEGGDFVGGVGNAVAAMLQSKGLIDQAKILSKFKEAIEMVAALAWLFAASLAIGAFAVFGNYKQALYLLIGPPLFYYMVTTPASTDGVQVKFGGREIPGWQGDQNRLLRWIRAIDGEIGEDGSVGGTSSVDVSYFFALYDAMVTEAVQRIADVVVNTRAKDDLRFIARERVLSYLLQSTPSEAPLLSLVSYYHLGECGDGIQKLLAQEGILFKVPIRYRPSDDITEGEEKVREVSWDTKDIVIEQPAKDWLLAMKDETIDENGTTFPDVPIDNKDEELTAKCEQIWHWVRGSMFYMAKEKLKPGSFQASFPDADSDTPWEVVYEDVREWLKGRAPGGQESNTDPLQVLAIFIYKNTLSHTTHSALQPQVFSRSPFNSKEYAAVFGDLAGSEGHGGYFKLKYFATAVPYIQGLLLYLLSIAFPFFAIFLVLPGRATSFLAWCALWVWVKSWDIGFALVYVARDILWYMMSNRVNVFEQPVEWDFPSTVMRIAFNNDPLYTQNIHWILVSGLTVMVPLLTAHLCLGATTMFDMFKNSIDQTAGRFSQVEANRARRHTANKIEKAQFQKLWDANMLYMKANYDYPMASAQNPEGAQTANGFPIAPNNLPRDWLSLTRGRGSIGTIGSANARGPSAAVSPNWNAMNMLNMDEPHRMEGSARLGKANDEQARLRKAQEEAGEEPTASVSQIHRGYISPHDTLPQTIIGADGRDQAFSEQEEFQRLFADAPHEIVRDYRAGKLTWNQFWNWQKQTHDDLGDRLATVTRRKQYTIRGAGGEGALYELFNQRQQVAAYVRSPLDGLSAKTMAQAELFLWVLSDGHSRADAPGIKIDSTGNNYVLRPKDTPAGGGGHAEQAQQEETEDGGIEGDPGDSD